MNAVPQAPQQAHPAAVAQEFMRRADMKGGEVEAFGQTFNWLGEFLSNELIATPAEAHHALLEELKELRAFREQWDKDNPITEKVETEDADGIPVLEPEVPAEELEAVDSEASE